MRFAESWKDGDLRVRLTNTASRETILVDKLPAVIGRDSSADVQLDDAILPPYQCMLGTDGSGDLTIWNLRQESPIRVNGHAVMKAPLSTNDRLTIGKAEFILALLNQKGA
jgi:hypothetical protein